MARAGSWVGELLDWGFRGRLENVGMLAGVLLDVGFEVVLGMKPIRFVGT